MRFVSTRGGMEPASFSDVLIEGLAPDGGLTVPETLPRFTAAELEAMRELSYPELAAKVIGVYWDDIAPEELLRLTTAAYGDQFEVQNAVRYTPLTPDFALLGLSEGPTLAFKDMAMQFLGEAIPYVLRQRARKLNLIGATSGDTGSAAEYAFRSKPGVNVFMLSPKGRMSDFQRAQMYSLTDENIHNLVVDGVFDDCQTLMKQLNGDLAYKASRSLGVVNSINFGRLAAQSVYYFWAWLRATDGLPEADRAGNQISVTVPSGNFGNLYSGFIAKRLGVPINRLIVATNENNVLDEFFRTGVYKPRSGAETFITSSPSMDISKASNLERFIYDLLADPSALRELFTALDQTGSVDLSEHLERFKSEFGISSGSSTHADRVQQISRCFAEYGVIIDPHTADGVKVAEEQRTPGEIMLVLETAKPQKFADTVTEALGKPAELTEAMQEMLLLPQRTTEIPADSAVLRNYIDTHTGIDS